MQSQTRKKTYSPPKLNKLTSEQTGLILIGHASCGDQGAKDLLDVFHALPERDGSQNVRARFEEDEPAQLIPGRSRLIRRAVTAFQSTREDFRRFVRG